MNPFAQQHSPTWPQPSEEASDPRGTRPGPESIEALLGEIQYGGGFSSVPSRSWRVIPVLLLLLGLGVGGAVGWYWGSGTSLLQSPTTMVDIPEELAMTPESLLAGEHGWELVWKGEVLRSDEQTLLSDPEPVAPSAPAPLRKRSRDSGGTMTKGYLGIRGVTFQQEGVEGVKILQVFPNSPADKAGLRPALALDPARVGEAGARSGQIIVAVNGQSMRSEEDLATFMDHSAPGDVMQVVVTPEDGSAREALIVVLDELPQPSHPAN